MEECYSVLAIGLLPYVIVRTMNLEPAASLCTNENLPFNHELIGDGRLRGQFGGLRDRGEKVMLKQSW